MIICEECGKELSGKGRPNRKFHQSCARKRNLRKYREWWQANRSPGEPESALAPKVYSNTCLLGGPNCQGTFQATSPYFRTCPACRDMRRWICEVYTEDAIMADVPR